MVCQAVGYWNILKLSCRPLAFTYLAYTHFYTPFLNSAPVFLNFSPVEVIILRDLIYLVHLCVCVLIWRYLCCIYVILLSFAQQPLTTDKKVAKWQIIISNNAGQFYWSKVLKTINFTECNHFCSTAKIVFNQILLFCFS